MFSRDLLLLPGTDHLSGGSHSFIHPFIDSFVLCRLFMHCFVDLFILRHKGAQDAPNVGPAAVSCPNLACPTGSMASVGLLLSISGRKIRA